MFRVAVLGAGPAALIAVHAAATHPEVDDVRILSRKVKSTMYGAQYLHQPIPDATFGDAVMINYELHGTAEEYRRKVYGTDWQGTVSPEDLSVSHPAWDIRETYDWLWMAYSPFITEVELNEFWPERIVREFDVVISAVPAPVICKERRTHDFSGTTIWAAGEAPELGIRLPYVCDDNTVICSGEWGIAWYRKSRIYGRMTVEWPGIARRPPISSVASVIKPLSNRCTCYPEITRVGRYGTWRKGVLSHESYATTKSAIDARLRDGVQLELS
jgi:hypothetical protein